MSKIIAVTGATGQQGGSVCRIMSEVGWKVRAITRNPSGDAGKKLASEGYEVVQANIDDVESLKKAFEGATAIFAVTNFWEHLFTGSSASQSGEKEAVQAWNLAQAAQATTSLDHFIWSTLPNASATSQGKTPVPHFDYKADVDTRIQKEMPELAAKTTFLWLGYYPSNMFFFPMCKPFEVAGSGKFVQMYPLPANEGFPNSGDMSKSTGIWCRQILAKPEKTKGAYAGVFTEDLSWEEMLKIWGEVTGKEVVYVQCSSEAFNATWGAAGEELNRQFQWGHYRPDWIKEYKNYVSKEDLGITEDIGFRSAIESLKHMVQ